MSGTAVFWILEPGSCAGHERSSCFLEKQMPVDGPTSSPTEILFSAQSLHGFKIPADLWGHGRWSQQLRGHVTPGTTADHAVEPSSCAGHVTPDTTADHAVEPVPNSCAGHVIRRVKQLTTL